MALIDGRYRGPHENEVLAQFFQKQSAMKQQEEMMKQQELAQKYQILYQRDPALANEWAQKVGIGQESQLPVPPTPEPTEFELLQGDNQMKEAQIKNVALGFMQQGGMAPQDAYAMAVEAVTGNLPTAGMFGDAKARLNLPQDEYVQGIGIENKTRLDPAAAGQEQRAQEMQPNLIRSTQAQAGQRSAAADANRALAEKRRAQEAKAPEETKFTDQKKAETKLLEKDIKALDAQIKRLRDIQTKRGKLDRAQRDALMMSEAAMSQKRRELEGLIQGGGGEPATAPPATDVIPFDQL